MTNADWIHMSTQQQRINMALIMALSTNYALNLNVNILSEQF